MSFGDRYKWHAQILGTESDQDRSWLWAWANEASNIPPNLLGAAKVLRIYGEHIQLPEFATPNFVLGEFDGHALAMIASGICRANAYCRAPYEGGAVYLLIQDDDFPRNQESLVARIGSVLPQAISSIEIADHRFALLGYLDYHNLGFVEEGSQIILKEDSEAVFIATFNEQNRLTNLEAHVEKAAPGVVPS